MRYAWICGMHTAYAVCMRACVPYASRLRAAWLTLAHVAEPEPIAVPHNACGWLNSAACLSMAYCFGAVLAARAAMGHQGEETVRAIIPCIALHWPLRLPPRACRAHRAARGQKVCSTGSAAAKAQQTQLHACHNCVQWGGACQGPNQCLPPPLRAAHLGVLRGQRRQRGFGAQFSSHPIPG